MKKTYLILVIILFLFFASVPSFAANMYGCTALTGGGAGALDALDITGSGAPNADNLADGDVALVATISGTTVTYYTYIFDADGTDAESSPNVIRPDDFSTQGVWRLVELHQNMIPDLSSTYQAHDSNLDVFSMHNPWRVFYFNGSGNASGLTLGAAGTLLKSTGTSSAPEWAVDGTDFWSPSSDGAGSGLDADTLDGHDSTYFATTSTKLDDFATPDDNTDLNATTTHHGLLPKLDGSTSNFLRGDGTWASPSGGSGSPGGSDTQMQYNNGGSFGGDSHFTVDDSTWTHSITQNGSNVALQIGDGTYSWDHSPQAGVEGAFEVDGTLYADGGVQTGSSATPGITGDDSDTSATTDWKIYGNATDTTAGSEDVDLFFQELVNGTLTTIMQLDADGYVEVTNDMNLASGKVYRIGGSQISASDLSNGTTGSGSIVLATSPTLTTPNIGVATATTPSANDNDTSVATTAYVQTELSDYASDNKTFTNTSFDADGTGNSLTNVDDGNMTSAAATKLNRYHQCAHFDPDNQYTNYDGVVVLDPYTSAAITISAIRVRLNEDPTTELGFTVYQVSDQVGYSGGTVIASGTTVAGTIDITSGWTDNTVPAGSKIWVDVTTDPDATTTGFEIVVEGTYD